MTTIRVRSLCLQLQDSTASRREQKIPRNFSKRSLYIDLRIYYNRPIKSIENQLFDPRDTSIIESKNTLHIRSPTHINQIAEAPRASVSRVYIEVTRPRVRPIPEKYLPFRALGDVSTTTLKKCTAARCVCQCSNAVSSCPIVDFKRSLFIKSRGQTTDLDEFCSFMLFGEEAVLPISQRRHALEGSRKRGSRGRDARDCLDSRDLFSLRFICSPSVVMQSRRIRRAPIVLSVQRVFWSKASVTICVSKR